MIAPQTADELTLEWLQHVLDENMFDCEFSSFDVDPEFNRASLLGVVVRVLLGYNSNCGGPNSIIVKFPTDNADTRSPWLANGVYEREGRIYQPFGERTDLAVPLRYFPCHQSVELQSISISRLVYFVGVAIIFSLAEAIVVE